MDTQQHIDDLGAAVDVITEAAAGVPRDGTHASVNRRYDLRELAQRLRRTRDELYKEARDVAEK